MKPIIICGIKNCDTMKKAFKWLDLHKIAYTFHDYKKSGGDKKMLESAIEQHGWQNVLNRKGTTWRALPEKLKEKMNDAQAMKTAIENPSIIRRPMIVQGTNIYFGFEEDNYKKMFLKK